MAIGLKVPNERASVMTSHIDTYEANAFQNESRGRGCHRMC